MYYDSFNGWWWDNCGSGFINVTSGEYLSLNGSNAYTWSENETHSYELQYEVAWSTMTAINASNATSDYADDGGSDDDDELEGLNAAEISFIVVACLVGAASAGAAGWWLRSSYQKQGVSLNTPKGKSPAVTMEAMGGEVAPGGEVMNPVAPDAGL